MIKMPDGKLFIGGEWKNGSGQEIVSIFPVDGSINCTFKGASQEDVLEAIELAKNAQSKDSWLSLKPYERAQYLYSIADGIESNIERISQIQTRDTGKTLSETSALARSASGTFRYYAALLESSDDSLTSQRSDSLTLSVYEPLGLISAITPWNSPIASDAQKLAPALAAGNAVLLKPSSWSPLVSLELAKIIESSGLPKGLFSVLPGAGSEVGSLLVEHPDISKVTFTGSTSTGRELATQAAQKLMPISLELGGKSPAIVFEDADIDVAISGVMFGIFSSTGQSCIAGSRLFIHESIYDEFLERLVNETNKLIVGDPYEKDTQVSSLIHHNHRDKVSAYVDRAIGDGGRILCGGKAPIGAEFEKGAYYLPTIIADVKSSSEIVQEEVFGPVLVVMPFKDEGDVIEQANDTQYGLACGIWTNNFPKAWRVGRAINAGTVWINTYKQFSISTPFGGEKSSGIGREKGSDGIRAYMSQKSLYIDLTGKPHQWANL